MDDHQTANAAAMGDAADIVTEAGFTAPALTALLEKRLSDPAELARRAKVAHGLGKPDAASALADLAERLAR
jgi:UDP-N-acetylglucosamine--N-acetylmuramyl-(pentapeptide) pyrophosphoryl-undecaprenol N-acetylglucosamine transferase